MVVLHTPPLSTSVAGKGKHAAAHMISPKFQRIYPVPQGRSEDLWSVQWTTSGGRNTIIESNLTALCGPIHSVLVLSPRALETPFPSFWTFPL